MENIYIYIGNGYSHGGWGGYSNITVASCSGRPSRQHWAKRMKVLESSYGFRGVTSKSAFYKEMRRIRKEWPGAVVVRDSLLEYPALSDDKLFQTKAPISGG